jgi:hypothetical protein
LNPLQKAQVLTQRRKAAKIFKKTFDLLCAFASWRLNLSFFSRVKSFFSGLTDRKKKHRQGGGAAWGGEAG